MSFGFGIGDFITVLTLANALRERFKDAPRQYTAISDEVQSLTIVLTNTKNTLQGRKLGKERTADLEIVLRGCHNVLEELNVELERFFPSGQEGKWDRGKIRTAWDRLRWDQKAIDGFRGRLVFQVGVLNTFILETESNPASAGSKVDEKQAILKWLDATDYAERQSDFLSLREKGTGDWFLESAQLLQWCSQPKQTLFCPGIPGAGKTVLASVIIQHLQRRFQDDETVPVVYIYCNFKMREKQKIKDLLKSLLSQFIQQHRQPSLPKNVKDFYERNEKQGTVPTLNELSKALPMVVATFARPLIVIDALDECETKENTRDHFLEELLGLQEKSKACLMIFSRPIHEIARRLEASVHFEIRAQPQDIDRYISARLPLLPMFVQRNEALKKRIISTIVGGVQGMFLLAQLLFESLRGKPNTKKLNMALKQIEEHAVIGYGKGIEELEYAYGTAMDRINSQAKDFIEIAHSVLSWITLARTPLSIKELQYALAVEDELPELDKDNVSDPDDILSACAGLVTIDDESKLVRLVHYTAQDYFDTRWTKWFPDAQLQISRACITYLSFKAFDHLCLSADEVEQRVDQHALYNYAALNWGYHVRSAAAQTEEFVIRFLASREKTASAYQVIHHRGNQPRQLNQNLNQQEGQKQEITGIHLAAYFGLKDAIARLAALGHDIDQEDGWQRTALSYAAERGHEEVVKYLLEERQVQMNSCGVASDTMTLAVKGGQENVVEYLMSRNQDNPSASIDVESAVIEAILSGFDSMVQLVLAQHRNVNLNQEREGHTILGAVAREGNETMMKILLASSNVDVNLGNFWSETPLIEAACNGHDAVVKLLVSQNEIKLDTQDAKFTRSALGWAVLNEHEPIVKLLLSAGANPDVADYRRQTPLSVAAEFGLEDLVSLLLEHRAQVDSTDYYGQTPLSFAAKNGHTSVVSRLLDAGADPTLRDSVYGKTSLLWAAEWRHNEIVRLLLDHEMVDCNDVDTQGQTALLWAVRTRNQELANELLSLDNIDVRAHDYATKLCPLAIAAEKGKTALVKLLLDRGADPSQIDANGSTPLLWAAWAGHKAVVEIFLTLGTVGPDQADSRGQTPLSWAAERGHHEVVRLLLDHGASLSIKDSKGRGPAWWAIWNGQVQVTDLLLSLNDPLAYEADEDGWSPIHWAFYNHHNSVVDLLRRNNRWPGGISHAEDQHLQDAIQAFLTSEDRIDFYSESFCQKSPLIWSVENSDFEVLDIVREGPKKPTILELGNALFTATKNGHLEVAQLLVQDDYLRQSANTTRFFLWSYVEATTQGAIDILELLGEVISPSAVEMLTNQDLLALALPERRFDVIRFLVEHGLDVNKKNQGVMIWAACYADDDLVQFLGEHKANLDVLDSEHGQTPLIWAVQRGHRGNVKALLELGVDPNYMGTCGFSPVVWAEQKGDEVIIEMLKAAGGEWKSQSKE
ncbi:ankyrin repeat-containing domain protein [Aspergillus heterothallicus]